jgi:hypothetical protein
MNIIILYACDEHHSKDSMVRLGAFSSRTMALGKLVTHLDACKSFPPLSDEDVALFIKIGQTQGYAGEGEFYSESCTLNELDCELEPSFT